MGRLQATCGARRSGVPCKQLRAFTCVCLQLRAFASGFERARSRLVAPIFFFVFGHVRARLGVFFRHFSSFFVPKWFFREWRATGGCGSGWAGRSADCCAWLPGPGGGWAKWHGIHLKSVYSCGRAAAAFVRFAHNCTTELGRLQFLKFPGCISEWGWVSDLL